MGLTRGSRARRIAFTKRARSSDDFPMESDWKRTRPAARTCRADGNDGSRAAAVLPKPPVAFDPAGDCLEVANALKLNDAPGAEGRPLAREHMSRASTCPRSYINGGNRFFVPDILSHARAEPAMRRQDKYPFTLCAAVALGGRRAERKRTSVVSFFEALTVG
jgi:hypothetical protein